MVTKGPNVSRAAPRASGRCGKPKQVQFPKLSPFEQLVRAIVAEVKRDPCSRSTALAAQQNAEIDRLLRVSFGAQSTPSP